MLWTSAQQTNPTLPCVDMTPHFETGGVQRLSLGLVDQ